jgi:hypothetical protein
MHKYALEFGAKGALPGMTWYRVSTQTCVNWNACRPGPHCQQHKEDDKDNQQPEIFS